MKIVFALKSPEFYENLSYRKSYITIKDGLVNDDVETMSNNLNEYMNNYFPTQQQIDEIPNNQNIKVIDAHQRIVKGIGPNNYNNIYTNTFQFWNNVNYAKLIYDNGFVEFCYINNRECDNFAVNQWNFTFIVDIWNTYWIDVYSSIKLSSQTLDVIRYTEDRFTLINYENNDYWIMKFLTTQDTCFWNKEMYEDNIKSKIVLESGLTIIPWQDYNRQDLIKEVSLLDKAYNYQTTPAEGTSRFFDTPPLRKGFTSIIYTVKDKSANVPGQYLSSFYGINNIFYIGPLVNSTVLNNDGTIKTEYDNFQAAYGEGSGYLYKANLLSTGQKSSLLIGTIFTPKPTLLPLTLNNLSFKDTSYPSRWDSPENKNEDYNITKISDLADPDDTNVAGMIISKENPPTSWIEPTITNRNSKLNCLCDERIDIPNLYKTFILSSTDLITKRIIELEPKIYDEELYNISYGHYNNNQLAISLKWYFYKNFDDLLKWKSIFIEGYQFVSLSYVGLMQYVRRGLYSEYNNDIINSGLLTSFSPWLSFSSSVEELYLSQNASQMNSTLNNKQNSWGANLATGGIATIGATVINPALGLLTAIGTFGSAIKGWADYDNLKRSQAAKLKDLSNSPTNFHDMSSSNNFKFVSSENGNYNLNHISEIDKYKIWSFHAETGYALNKLINMNELSSFASRLYYNSWQIAKLKTAMINLNILNEYKNYFEDIFEKGLTLFHYDVIINNVKYKTKLGNFENENWEIKLWNFLK